MKIRKLIINNFRGIKFLDWELDASVACLIGPGDSTKSTILDAISLLFTPRWNPSISDLDFYQLEVTTPIEINAYITHFPDALLLDDKYGLFLQFWNKSECIHETEKPGDDVAIQVCLRITETLEPKWFVKSLETDEEKAISSHDRSLLSVSDIGSHFQRDFSWGSISALTTITGKTNTINIPAILAKVARLARDGIKIENFDELGNAISIVEKASADFGVKPKEGFKPGVDPSAMSMSSGTLILYDGLVPLRVRGLGSRRMVSIAMQHELTKNDFLVLIDEIEYGLEPYRLRNMLRVLRQNLSERSQVMMTSHSNVAIVELFANEIFVVKHESGTTTVTQVASDLQDAVRKFPEAFLTKSVIMCEGKTEWGVLTALDSYWKDGEEKQLPLAYLGVMPAYGLYAGRTVSPKYAKIFSELGYRACYFGDSDDVIVPSEEKLIEAGVRVFLWPGKVSTEERICLDLPLSGLGELVSLAIEVGSESDVLKEISLVLDPSSKTLSRNELFSNVTPVIRQAIGTAAKQKGWFKNDSNSIKLGELLCKYLNEMTSTETYRTLVKIQRWCNE